MTRRKPAYIPDETHSPSVGDSTRVCPKCNDHKPLTSAYWTKDPHGPDGVWHHQCKDCKNGRRRELSRQIQLRELELVKKELYERKINSTGEKGHPTRAEMAQELINVWGSESTIIEDLVADYRISEPGSQQRWRYMDLVIKILDRAAEQAPVKNIEDMTSEEIEASLATIYEAQKRKVEKGVQQRVTIESEATVERASSR